MNPSKRQDYTQIYRGIFDGPLDYKTAKCTYESALICNKIGIPLSERQIIACGRIRKLEELGGIREPLSDKPISDQELRLLMDIGKLIRKSKPQN